MQSSLPLTENKKLFLPSFFLRGRDTVEQRVAPAQEWLLCSPFDLEPRQPARGGRGDE